MLHMVECGQVKYWKYAGQCSVGSGGVSYRDYSSSDQRYHNNDDDDNEDHHSHYSNHHLHFLPLVGTADIIRCNIEDFCLQEEGK